MRLSLFPVVAILSVLMGEALMRKRLDSTEPAASQLIGSSVFPASLYGDRFDGLPSDVYTRMSACPKECYEDEDSEETKKPPRLRTRAKKLEAQLEMAKRIYLLKHSQEEYAVLESEAVLEAIERENSGKRRGSGARNSSK